ncbi:interferon-stimulated 20 kDa exonuclease-like 2 [Takifugu flavidus]|uniref:Interferon-stimulated 20 kDa exonuclease-like 2 n=1 Tax=Takifugu flavidus TaxID=433684 RepID=A0A5C6PN06_9TELE|nr:interferon-stimulated 20 kDa exonuclease-like 2 [Takifugu flavidus]XP_056900384.1 interferon-stimulated 20 kDa exonuclease-like 2 [Takifugu flavidus]XP_056900385.1 interferon-stimulated 20 kDa exonuclease-like 2 [Takifugu flavidus]XP_056900386.1 interferon-stimulated 20 kDa exonuclease-like 2 [Takifugu flavidus]TWW79797.1 Interferon-stimulated 20 kDa exonuclease-like 2 [Takifugu flavidus]
MSDINIIINLDLTPRVLPVNKKRTRERKRKRDRKKMRHLRNGRQLETKGNEKSNNLSKRGSKYDAAQSSHNGALRRHPPLSTSTQPERCPPNRTADPSPAAPCSAASTGSHSPSILTQSKDDDPSPSVEILHKPAVAPLSAGIPSNYLAIDCEMVGTGPKGSVSQLGRCSLVSYDGDVVYDKFIKPPVPVTDYRTRWSGIRPRDLANATPFPVARKEILKLLMGKVVIGHAIHNDFKVLSYSHPAALTRDTMRIPLLNAKAGLAVTECASLKRLTKAIFKRDIQTGKKGHSSVEDARATMELYKVVEVEWEKQLASKSQSSSCQK